MRGVNQISEFQEQEEVLPATVKVVNWNAQKLTDSRFPEDLREIIEKERPDIVFLQEARGDLLQKINLGGYFATGWKFPWPGGTTIGVMTLSSVPPEKVQPVHSKYREFAVTAPKVSLLTEHPLPNGETLLAVNVHLLNFERWSVKKIGHQLDQLKAIMEEHSGPIVLAGDFNTWNKKRLGLASQFAEDLHLKEVTEFPAGRTTADMQSSCLNWFFGVDKKLPLDRVYYRGFTNSSAQVLSYESSDHRPILVKLTLAHSQ
jgi:endonuclease/exonuclease/phosphatase (EEP) superfamily protein YafD